MPTRRTVSRRDLLKAAAVVPAAAPYVLASSALGAEGRPPASERIVFGYIGCGGRGFGAHVRGFTANKEVQSVALSDVDHGRLQRAREWVNSTWKSPRSGCGAR